jgi:ankyrin repeat protein
MRCAIWLVLALGVAMPSENAIGASGFEQASTVFPDRRIAEVLEAVERGNMDAAKRLTSTGVDLNVQGKSGITPLLWVMGSTLDPGKAGFLIRQGADPNVVDPSSGVSAMHLAAGGDRPAMLEALLQNGGNANLRGKGGESLLMAALAQQRDRNVEILLKHGADINHVSDSKDTAAIKAAAFGRYDWVARFLDLGLSASLDRLASTVGMRRVPAGSKQDALRGQVIAKLRSQGLRVDVQ